MLGFFRRITKSRIGIFVGLAFLAIIAVGFAVADINGLRGAGNLSGGTVAEVDGEPITDRELTARLQQELQGIRQQQPAASMAQLLAAGALNSVLEQMITVDALYAFGTRHGFVASDQAVDGQIASLPAFQGLDGRFSQDAFDRVLAQQGLTPEAVRDDIRRGMVTQWLTAPTVGASQVPEQLAVPYASLLLERRAGQVAVIPASAIAQGAAPTDAELATFYQRNRARYTVPERRVIRYAMVTPASVAGQATPSEAQIQQAFRANAARYAASERRTVRQVVMADQAAATALANRVRGGTVIDQAARAAGLEASLFTDLTRGELTARTAPTVAAAAFAGGQGAVAGPVRSPLGWHVLRIEAVTTTPARTLDQVREQLVAEVTKTKQAAALGRVQSLIDTGINDGATFDEIAGDAKLSPQTTAPVTAQGVNPDRPGAADPQLTRIVQTAFAAAPDDGPQIVQVGNDGSFAVVALANIVPAAPRPLAQVRDAVRSQFVQDRALAAARAAATQVVTRVNAGQPLSAALAASNLRLPAPQPVSASRAEINAGRSPVLPQLGALFALGEKKARLVALPNRAGWSVVFLDTITRTNAAGNQAAIRGTRAGLGRAFGAEYTEQFARAVRGAVGVERNEGAIRAVRDNLAGTAPVGAN